MLRRALPLVLLCVPFACEVERDDAQQRMADVSRKASEAAQATRELADDTAKTTAKVVDATKQAVDTTKDAAGKGKALLDSASALWADIPGTGELSKTAKSWLATASSNGSIEATIHRGQQIAPVALEIGKSVGSAIDSETRVEPIYQAIEDGKQAQLDAAIEDMPRTEVVDGLTLGFKQLDELSNEKTVKERGYLVTWRDGDHLYGFVYRSKRTIDIDKLVTDAPRLLRLTKSVVGAG